MVIMASRDFVHRIWLQVHIRMPWKGFICRGIWSKISKKIRDIYDNFIYLFIRNFTKTYIYTQKYIHMNQRIGP